MYAHLASKLAQDELIILDGGIGTDIQRRGVAMDGEFWCAMANLSDAATVSAVHRDYVDAGAEVITANTYASSPLSFAARGRAEEIEAIDRTAVAIARGAVEAAASRPLAVAGSISVMPPIARGTDDPVSWSWSETDVRPLYRRKAETLADAGCDLLIMEMMRDAEVSLWATEEAVATGLPVWVGISVEADDDGRLVGHGVGENDLAELTRVLMGTGAKAALVMHNALSTTDEALAILQRHWTGPVGTYPEAGHFEMPDWVFRDVSPERFVACCRRWREAGAGILGGCCGITPTHIAALHRAGLA